MNGLRLYILLLLVAALPFLFGEVCGQSLHKPRRLAAIGDWTPPSDWDDPYAGGSSGGDDWSTPDDWTNPYSDSKTEGDGLSWSIADGWDDPFSSSKTDDGLGWTIADGWDDPFMSGKTVGDGLSWTIADGWTDPFKTNSSFEDDWTIGGGWDDPFAVVEEEESTPLGDMPWLLLCCMTAIYMMWRFGYKKFNN